MTVFSSPVGRTTSRVLAEPGGGSSISLSWSSSSPLPKGESRFPRRGGTLLFTSLSPFHPESPTKKSENKEDKVLSQKDKRVDDFQVVGASTGETIPRRLSSNLYANGSSQNCGNVLTDIPTTKVSQPPGVCKDTTNSKNNENFLLTLLPPTPCPSSKGGRSSITFC